MALQNASADNEGGWSDRLRAAANKIRKHHHDPHLADALEMIAAEIHDELRMSPTSDTELRMAALGLAVQSGAMQGSVDVATKFHEFLKGSTK